MVFLGLSGYSGSDQTDPATLIKIKDFFLASYSYEVYKLNHGVSEARNGINHLLYLDSNLLGIGTYYDPGDTNEKAIIFSIDQATSLNSVNWSRAWDDYQGVTIEQLSTTSELVFTMNKIDYGETTGRVNYGT